MPHGPRPQETDATGRQVTEWFERAVRPEEVEKPWQSDPNAPKTGGYKGLTKETAAYYAAKGGRKGRRTKFKGGMSNQEVQVRLDEASKMVNPENQKMLPPDVQERTGLEMNPLWMIETLVRGGVLSAKDQVSALKTLAEYTYSKAPTVSHNANVEVSAEDWLQKLAEEEYPEVQIEQRKTAPHGKGKRYLEHKQRRIDAGTQAPDPEE